MLNMLSTLPPHSVAAYSGLQPTLTGSSANHLLAAQSTFHSNAQQQAAAMQSLHSRLPVSNALTNLAVSHSNPLVTGLPPGFSNEMLQSADAMKYLNSAGMFPSLNSMASHQTAPSLQPNLAGFSTQPILALPPDFSNPFKDPFKCLTDFTRSGFGEREQLFSRYSILSNAGGGTALTDKITKENATEKRVFISS